MTGEVQYENPTAPADKQPERERVSTTGKSSSSKTDSLVRLLCRRQGATLAALMKSSGWQAHSVRGFLAGTVRKKLCLNLVSEKVDGHRIYRIVSNGA